MVLAQHITEERQSSQKKTNKRKGFALVPYLGRSLLALLRSEALRPPEGVVTSREATSTPQKLNGRFPLGERSAKLHPPDFSVRLYRKDVVSDDGSSFQLLVEGAKTEI